MPYSICYFIRISFFTCAQATFWPSPLQKVMIALIIILALFFKLHFFSQSEITASDAALFALSQFVSL